MQMTNKRLKRLYYINRDIDRLQQRIDELESVAEGTTRPITGLPGGFAQSDKIGNCAVRLSVLRAQLDAAKADAQLEYEETTSYIESLDDPIMRQIMQYRHLNCLPWEETAALIGGGNTAAGIRQMYKRFLDTQK